MKTNRIRREATPAAKSKQGRKFKSANSEPQGKGHASASVKFSADPQMMQALALLAEWEGETLEAFCLLAVQACMDSSWDDLNATATGTIGRNASDEERAWAQKFHAGVKAVAPKDSWQVRNDPAANAKQRRNPKSAKSSLALANDANGREARAEAPPSGQPASREGGSGLMPVTLDSLKKVCRSAIWHLGFNPKSHSRATLATVARLAMDDLATLDNLLFRVGESRCLVVPENGRAS